MGAVQCSTVQVECSQLQHWRAQEKERAAVRGGNPRVVVDCRCQCGGAQRELRGSIQYVERAYSVSARLLRSVGLRERRRVCGWCGAVRRARPCLGAGRTRRVRARAGAGPAGRAHGAWRNWRDCARAPKYLVAQIRGRAPNGRARSPDSPARPIGAPPPVRRAPREREGERLVRVPNRSARERQVRVPPRSEGEGQVRVPLRVPPRSEGEKQVVLGDLGV